tara:strand:+ start:86 stop:754 length:669 start_codon:yes stop_codon:yes gene_type:complete
MDEQKLVQVFCRLCGFTNPSTNSSECPTCRTLEWRTDFLPSQQRIVDFQTQLLIPCRNQTFESVELECTNQTVFSLIKNQSVKEGENCKNCGQPWASSNELNLERIKDSLKSKGIDLPKLLSKGIDLPKLTVRNWFDYLNEEDRELVKKYNLYSVFKKGEPEFKFVPFFEYVFLDLKKNWNSPSWWLKSIAYIIIFIILFLIRLWIDDWCPLPLLVFVFLPA